MGQLSTAHIFLDKTVLFRLYLYGGLGWWFGSLGNQIYVQNRLYKGVSFVLVFCVCFVSWLTNLIYLKYLSIYLYFYLFVCLSFYLFTYLISFLIYRIYLFACLSIYLSTNLIYPICLSICLSFCLLN